MRRRQNKRSKLWFLIHISLVQLMKTTHNLINPIRNERIIVVKWYCQCHRLSILLLRIYLLINQRLLRMVQQFRKEQKFEKFLLRANRPPSIRFCTGVVECSEHSFLVFGGYHQVSVGFVYSRKTVEKFFFRIVLGDFEWRFLSSLCFVYDVDWVDFANCSWSVENWGVADWGFVDDWDEFLVV